ncbi:MAG TPA: NF038132 family protein [Burkholderiaceae bacterium]|nr:NF038132 family protein [Burkholderiaceae bacterium]
MNTRKWLIGAALFVTAPWVLAQGFNGGLPAGWTCAGTCGTLGANGDITLSGVAGSTAYGYVVTGGSNENGKLLSPFDSGGGFGGGGLGGETNGSRLRSGSFGALAGDALNFKFNYISSDGTGSFIEYAWAVVRNAADNSVAALLFTGRTNPSGPPVPGFGLPPASATVNGGVPVVMHAGGPHWSPLGGYSGACYGAGCGYTGWVDSTFAFGATGNYYLEFGVINWGDTAYDAGFAFDGITVAGVPIEDIPGDPVGSIPEPSTYAMLVAGLAMLGFMARRRRNG